MPAEMPQFSLENDLWKATVTLPSWRGFQSRKGAYGARDSAVPSDGRVLIVFAPEGREGEPLTEAELSTVRWVIEHEASLANALLLSLLKEYPSLQEQYSGEVEEELMPDVESVDDLRALIGLSSINVHPVQKDGVPYVGFEFGCTWDEEHGLGVLMHGTRTVEIGGADTAITLWIAQKDAKKSYRTN